MLIGVEDRRLAFDRVLDGQDLLLEVTGLDGGRGPLVALERQLILGLSADVVLLRHILRGDTHVAIPKGVRETPQDRVNQLGIAQALAPAGS